MKYQGSKNRIAKDILPIILKNRNPRQWYVEPFVGGGNMIDKVEGKRIGADINQYLIKALKFIRDTPEKIPLNNLEYSEQDFNAAKKSNLDNPLDCFAMFNYTFGSKFKGSWAKNKRGSDYVKESVQGCLKQSENLKGVILKHCSFLNLQIPDKSIIYCDPPYKNTSGYGIDFNHDIFWDWVRTKVSEGHSVFVSEYQAPDDFVCVWEKEILSTSGVSNTKKATEKLFVFVDQYLDS